MAITVQLQLNILCSACFALLFTIFIWFCIFGTVFSFISNCKLLLSPALSFIFSSSCPKWWSIFSTSFILFLIPFISGLPYSSLPISSSNNCKTPIGSLFLHNWSLMREISFIVYSLFLWILPSSSSLNFFSSSRFHNDNFLLGS